MQKILFFSFLFIINTISAQFYRTPWVSQVELEISIPMKVEYSNNQSLYYTEKGNEYVRDTNLDKKVIYGVNYSINYEWFDKFSVGGMAGFTYLPYPSMLVSKLGGILHYNAIEELNMDFFLSLSCFFPITKDVKTDIGEGKVGINFALFNQDKYLFYITSYLIIADFKRETSTFCDKQPYSVAFKGGGLGVGVKF